MQTVFRVLLGCSLLLNAYYLFIKDRGAGSASPQQQMTVQGVTVSDGAPPQPMAASDSVPAPTAAPEAPVTSSGARVADTAGEVVEPESGLRFISLEVKGSFAQTFNEALGRESGDLVSAVFSRILMWRLDLKVDIRKGDRIDLVYRVIPEMNQVEIAAARYHSKKLNQVFEAYWYKPSDRKFGSFFDEKGVEVPQTMENAPIKDYEQITALLRDRPRHQGMDFKTPVGTPITSPHKGRVTRVNWNPPNGTCVEIEFAESKVMAKFLHLSRLMPEIAVGKGVSPGQVIAESGNTGHSTAPHLHYQLEKSSGAIMDPLDFHKTLNASLPSQEMAPFGQVRDRWSRVLASKA